LGGSGRKDSALEKVILVENGVFLPRGDVSVSRWGAEKGRRPGKNSGKGERDRN